MSSNYETLTDEERVSLAIDFAVRDLPIPSTLSSLIDKGLINQIQEAQHCLQ